MILKTHACKTSCPKSYDATSTSFVPFRKFGKAKGSYDPLNFPANSRPLLPSPPQLRHLSHWRGKGLFQLGKPLHKGESEDAMNGFLRACSYIATTRTMVRGFSEPWVFFYLLLDLQALFAYLNGKGGIGTDISAEDPLCDQGLHRML